MTSSHTPRLPVQAPEGIKSPVAVATIEEIDLEGLQVINGYQLNVNDRVLVKNQTDLSTNGIYSVQQRAWVRAKDWKVSQQVANGVIILDNNTGQLWRGVFAGVLDIGVTDVSFTDVTSSGRTVTYVQETLPVGPIQDGAKWYKPSEATTYIYFVDEDSGQWVEDSVQSTEGTLRTELAAIESNVLVGGVEAGKIGSQSFSEFEDFSSAQNSTDNPDSIIVARFDADSDFTFAQYRKTGGTGTPSTGNAGLFYDGDGNAYELVNNPTDKVFGCTTSRSDSAPNYLEYLTYCWSSGRKGFTESGELTFADGVDFQGGGSANNVIGFLITEGELKINLGNNATKSALGVKYVHYVNLGKITVDGNKLNQTTTINGLVFQWIDTLIADKGSRADNCYQHGVLLFKIKNIQWIGGGGSNNGGVDPTGVVSNGILALAVGTGTIANVITHFNNPSTTTPGNHDGNGVQIGQSSTDDAFWSQSDFRQLHVYGVDAVQNGRRGLKIQRGNVVSWGNKLSNNYSSNLAIVEVQPLENIVVFGSKLGSVGDTTFNTIKIGSTSGGSIQNVRVFGNTFLGSPDGQAVDIDLDSDAIRMFGNIEQWSGGFSVRYQVRAGVTDVQIETNENINDLTSGEVTQIRPAELGNIQPNQIKQPGATVVKTLTSNTLEVDDYTGSVNISVADGTTDLNTINGGYPGQIITLRTNNSAGDVTVKSQVGNIYLAGNVDMPLGYPFDRLMLQFTDFGGTEVWVEISRADNF